MTPFALLLPLVAFSGVVAPPTAEQVAAEYPAYQRVSSHAVLGDPALAQLCTSVAPSVLLGPHFEPRISIYANSPAASVAHAEGVSPRYPEGAVIVKRKERENGTPTALGGMIKRARGYDPANGDWEYFFGPIGGPFDSGRLANCADCHMRAQASDFVFGDWAPHRDASQAQSPRR